MAALALTVENNVGCITLLRGDSGNPFDVGFCAELLAAIDSCQSAQSGVRAILIRSEGKNFSFGGDLRWLAAQGDRMAEAAKEPVAALNMAVLALSRGDAPVVVAVNGMAAGGAVGLVAVADFVVAADDARFYAAFSGIGLSCDTGCSYFLPRLVGARRATDFLLLNQTWDIETAHRAGLVSHRSSREGLANDAMALAEELARGPTLAFGEIRRLLRSAAPLELQLEAEAAGIAKTAATRDMRRAVDALLAKVPVEFDGN